MLKRGEPTDEYFRFYDRYQWLPGGHFIEHVVSGELGGTALQGVEIIGYEGKTLRATSYDSLGKVTHYRALLRGREWSAVGDKERFKGRFSAHGKQLAGIWERRSSGRPWHPIMRVILTRVGA